jgi:hypothetical protein
MTTTTQSLRPITVLNQKMEFNSGLPQNRTTAMTTTMTTQQLLAQIEALKLQNETLTLKNLEQAQELDEMIMRENDREDEVRSDNEEDEEDDEEEEKEEPIIKFQAICRGWIERTKKEEEEREYEYSHCGEDKDTGEIIVAGGGMMNGNAYATIKIVDDCTVLYREYGKNAWSEVYRNSELEWCDEGYNFDVVPC